MIASARWRDNLTHRVISTQVGEISTAIIRKDYGFKEGPLADQPLRCRLELVKIEPQTPNWEITTTDLKIEAVNAKRCLGNAWVARSDVPRAIRRYGAAIEIGDSDYDITDEDEKRKLREAVAACKLNRAMWHPVWKSTSASGAPTILH